MRLLCVRLSLVGVLAFTGVVLSARPAAAQIDFDIAGFWDQPALGTVLGPGVAAIFGFEEDSTERADGPRSSITLAYR